MVDACATPSQSIILCALSDSVAKPSLSAFPVDFQSSCFQQLTNPSFHKPLVFSSIQNAGGWRGVRFTPPSRHSSVAIHHFCITSFLSVVCPFNFQLSTATSPASPLFVALPYISAVSPLSTAFTHFNRGGGMTSRFCGIGVGGSVFSRLQAFRPFALQTSFFHRPSWRTKSETIWATRVSWSGRSSGYMGRERTSLAALSACGKAPGLCPNEE
jgi:hypothetical protein